MDLSSGQFMFGGVSEYWRSKLIWSNGPVTDVLSDYHSFRLFHFKICGVDMFQNLTTTWHALVDTGASCLGLPAEFFDMVISWLPMRCALGKIDNIPRLCYLSTEVRTSSLPTISFKLADVSKKKQQSSLGLIMVSVHFFRVPLSFISLSLHSSLLLVWYRTVY